MNHRITRHAVLGSLLAALAVQQAWCAEGAGPYYATPSWDQTLPAATRFLVLTNMPGAVLDRETGLVWEKQPSATPRTWRDALSHCLNLRTGGRMGWRLPAVQELLTLVDPAQGAATVPIQAPHPFVFDLGFNFVSASTVAGDASLAWVASAAPSGASAQGFLPKTNPWHVLCVRGGQGGDAQ